MARTISGARLEGLTDEPRPGAPRKAADDRIVELITWTLEGPPPAQATQWTTRSMADVAGLSKATISWIWQTFGLQSHRLDTFKLSADPQFVEKVRFRKRMAARCERAAIGCRPGSKIRVDSPRAVMMHFLTASA